jgi:hypothetical protein
LVFKAVWLNQQIKKGFLKKEPFFIAMMRSATGAEVNIAAV